MKERIYIFTTGTLSRKDNTLALKEEDGKTKYIPVERVKEIYVFSELTFNKRALEFITKNQIIIHFFNHYGYYIGTYYPREHYNSGYMILKQANFYQDGQKRLYLAKQFVSGSTKNILKVLNYYKRRAKDLKDHIKKIEQLGINIQDAKDVDTLMSYEAAIKKVYYDSFNQIIDNKDFTFTYRSKRPPHNYINALISFSNSLIYVQVLSEIYHTHLDPRIGYLHTTNFRSFSLNLDIAEIFKVVIGDRVIFTVLNKRIIQKNDFDLKFKGIVLKENARKKFIAKFEEKLQDTIKHSKLKRKVSYKRLMRLELYKLEKHLIGEEEYKPFIMDW